MCIFALKIGSRTRAVWKNEEKVLEGSVYISIFFFLHDELLQSSRPRGDGMVCGTV